jgi:hypothetical protein
MFDAMGQSLTNPLFLAALSVLMTTVALAYSFRQGQGSLLSRKGLILTAAPGVLALVAFYSLALHMHSQLGGWPDSIGYEGLPQQVTVHAGVAQWFFMIALLAALVMPLVMGVFSLAPKLRAKLVYPAFCGTACWLCLFLTTFAPTGFLNWWWD